MRQLCASKTNAVTKQPAHKLLTKLWQIRARPGSRTRDLAKSNDAPSQQAKRRPTSAVAGTTDNIYTSAIALPIEIAVNVGGNKLSQPRPPAEHLIIQYYVKPRGMWCSTPAKRLWLPSWYRDHRSEWPCSKGCNRQQLCAELQLQTLGARRASASSLLATRVFSSSFPRFVWAAQLHLPSLAVRG